MSKEPFRSAPDLRLHLAYDPRSGTGSIWLHQGDDVGDGPQAVAVSMCQLDMLESWLREARAEFQRLKDERGDAA